MTCAIGELRPDWEGGLLCSGRKPWIRPKAIRGATAPPATAPILRCSAPAVVADFVRRNATGQMKIARAEEAAFLQSPLERAAAILFLPL